MIVDEDEIPVGPKHTARAEKAKEAAESATLANMRHELQTPLNAVIGYSEMLIANAKDQALKAFFPDL